jgi:TolB-like protein/DNA-binding winged helix-turn-helix (wHTH) protein/Flp pilus assembly protein TadD
MPSPSGRTVYTFGPFQIDAEDRVLRCDGAEVPLTRKAAETLLVLVENAGHVMEKNALLARVWADAFVEESTLAQNILTLRKALGKQPYGLDYITTLPKRGYRFEAEVRRLGNAQEVAATAEEVPPPSGHRRFWLWAAAAFVVVVAVSLALVFVPGPPKPAANTLLAKRVRLAVLPFANLGGEQPRDYLSEGLTEEIITQIGSLSPEQLAVVARSSATRHQNAQQDVRQIGQELGVDYLLQGSVRREGQRVRVSVQLTRVADQSTLWAANYDRELRSILALESDVARSVATQIALHVSPEEAAHLENARPVNPQAYELYLKGRFFLNKRTVEGFEQSADLFQQAIALDPNYARAYAGLADSYIMLGAFGIQSTPEVVPKARAAALRAIEIDERSTEPHASMGFILSRYDWNWPEAEREFKRAIELDPSYTTAHHWYALHLSGLGRATEAIDEIRLAQHLDPASPLLATDAGLVLYSARQYRNAKKDCEKALELDPNYGLAHRTLGLINEEMGRHKEALAEFQQARGSLGDDPWMMAEIGRSYARAGNREQALQAMRELRQLSKRRYVSPLALALLCASLDPKSDETFDWLEKAYASRINLSGLTVDPGFDAIRGDSRFQNLLKRASLPERKMN